MAQAFSQPPPRGQPPSQAAWLAELRNLNFDDFTGLSVRNKEQWTGLEGRISVGTGLPAKEWRSIIRENLTCLVERNTKKLGDDDTASVMNEVYKTSIAKRPVPYHQQRQYSIWLEKALEAYLPRAIYLAVEANRSRGEYGKFQEGERKRKRDEFRTPNIAEINIEVQLRSWDTTINEAPLTTDGIAAIMTIDDQHRDSAPTLPHHLSLDKFIELISRPPINFRALPNVQDDIAWFRPHVPPSHPNGKWIDDDLNFRNAVWTLKNVTVLPQAIVLHVLRREFGRAEVSRDR